MPINSRRPFMEMVEVVQNELIREAAVGEESKYKGQINQVYTNDLPSVLPEKYIMKIGVVTLAAEYSAGTVTIGSGTSNFVGTSTVWTSAHTYSNIKISGYDQIYRVTYGASTSLTFNNTSLSWTGSSGSGLSYSLFRDAYALPSDFSYMVSDNPDSPNVVYLYRNGARTFLTPISNEEYNRRYTSAVQDPPSEYTVAGDAETTYLFVWPNPLTADHLAFVYIPELTEMKEHTTGTATFTTGTAVVLTADATPTTSLNTANTLYIRNDADGTGSESVWNKISTVLTNSTITLSANYVGTSGSGISYTISDISKWPARFDDAILYRTAYMMDPDGLQQNKWMEAYQTAISLDKSVEAKRKRGHRMKYFPGARR